MAFSLDDIRSAIRAKFIETPQLDLETGMSEIDTVRFALKNLERWGVPIKTLKDIAQLHYIFLYHDDEYASTLIGGRSDQLQTARFTLAALHGDCEDIHRAYEAVAIALGVHPKDAMLLIAIFGDEEKITGGHASLLIRGKGAYINLDYNNYVTSKTIEGILGHHNAYGNVVAYALLIPDETNPIIRYKDPIVERVTPSDDFKVEVIEPRRETLELARRLHRKSEHESSIPWMILIGGLLAALILGVKG